MADGLTASWADTGGFADPEEERRRRLNPALLAPTRLDASIFLQNPGLGMMPGALPASAATGGNPGEMRSPEAQKIADQLLAPTGSDLGNTRGTPARPDTWAVKLRAAIEAKVDEVNQKDAAAASINPFFRRQRIFAAQAAHSELDQLVRLYGHVAPMEEGAPFQAARVEAEKAHAGYWRQAGEHEYEQGARLRTQPFNVKDLQAKTGEFFTRTVSPGGVAVAPTGVVGQVDLGKEGARGAGHYEEDAEGNRTWHPDFRPPTVRPPASPKPTTPKVPPDLAAKLKSFDSDLKAAEREHQAAQNAYARNPDEAASIRLQNAEIAHQRAQRARNVVLAQIQAQTTPTTTPANAPTATGPNGQKLILRDNQWVPLG